jgi:hypothetical protein
MRNEGRRLGRIYLFLFKINVPGRLAMTFTLIPLTQLYTNM